MRRVVVVAQNFEPAQTARVLAAARPYFMDDVEILHVPPTRKGALSLPTLGARDLLVICVRGLPHSTFDTALALARKGIAPYVVVQRFSLQLGAAIAAECQRKWRAVVP